MSLVNVNHGVGEVRRVARLIWRTWKCALCGTSRRGPESPGKSQRLTRRPIRAFPNVEGSDSPRSSSGTRYIHFVLSDSCPTPFAALTLHSIIYSCKQLHVQSAVFTGALLPLISSQIFGILHVVKWSHQKY